MVKIGEVETYLQENKEYALGLASSILDREISWQSFNGIIGGKNKAFNVSPSNYHSAEEYVAAWKKSHSLEYEKYGYNTPHSAAYRIQKLLDDSILEEYIEKFLARTYLRA